MVGPRLKDVWDKGVPTPPKGIPWYGRTRESPPGTEAQLEIRDAPGSGNRVVVGGQNDGASWMQFLTKFVCEKDNDDNGDYTVLQQFLWHFYAHKTATPEWSKFVLWTDQVNQQPNKAACD